MRTIDADALMPLFMKKANTMKDRHGVKLGEEWLLNYNDIKDVIDNAPTVDTTCPNCDSGYAQGYSDGYLKGKEERPQGEWIKISPANIYECSKCHQVVMTSDIKCYLYCHQCGTEMRVKHELNNELNELNHEKEHKERIFNPFDHRTIGEI